MTVYIASIMCSRFLKLEVYEKSLLACFSFSWKNLLSHMIKNLVTGNGQM